MNCASDGCAGWASGVRRRSELTSEAPVVDRPAVSMLGLVTGAGSAASAEGESDKTWCAVAAHDVVHMENRFARCRAEGAHGEFFTAAAAPPTRRAPRHRGTRGTAITGDARRLDDRPSRRARDRPVRHSMTPVGHDPTTYWLKASCSTN